MAEASSVKDPEKRRTLGTLAKLAIGGFMLSGGLVTLTEVVARLRGRQEHWPDTPLFKEIEDFSKDKPISKEAYLTQAKTILGGMDKEILPLNMNKVWMDILWSKPNVPLDDMYVARSRNPDGTKSLTGKVVRPGRLSDLIGIREISGEILDIENNSKNPLSEISLGIIYEFKPKFTSTDIPDISNVLFYSFMGKRPRDVIHYEDFSVDFSNESSYGFVKWHTDGFKVGDIRIEVDVAEYFDEKGGHKEQKKYISAYDNSGNSLPLGVQKLTGVYVSLADWYNNEAKKAGK